MIERWTAERARTWFAAKPWLMGCNFTPSNAINQLEMWQAATFDPITIERELTLAASIGMNAVRVYLHDLLWLEDPKAFLDRINVFLGLAEKHGIGTMLVLFDSCWHPEPVLGPQRGPLAGVHNSGWLQSPGVPVLRNVDEHHRLEDYVKGVVGRFADDPRVLVWDIWNEPDKRARGGALRSGGAEGEGRSRRAIVGKGIWLGPRDGPDATADQRHMAW